MLTLWLMAKYDYFISYSSKDKEIAYKIVDAIESTGHTCWIAPRNIPYGTPYARAIMEGIDECNTFIVLITDNSIKSEDVLNEVDNAHASKKKIIPIKLTDVLLSRELNYYLSRTQWMSLNLDDIDSIVTILKLKDPHKNNTIPSFVNDELASTKEIECNETEKELHNNDETIKVLEQERVKETLDYKSAEEIDKTIDSKANPLSRSKNHTKTKKLYYSLIGFSVIWICFALFFRNPNRNLLFLSFLISLSLCGILIWSLIKPHSFGCTRKQSLLFLGLSSLLFFFSGIAFTEVSIQQDIHADWIMTSSDILDNSTCIDRNNSSSKFADEKITDYLAEQKLKGDSLFEIQDYKEAVKYFNILSDADNGYGHYMLGKCFYFGYGVKKDLKKAFELYSLAASQNIPEAVNGLGVCYLNGRGTKQDFDKAAECFRKAADEGLPVAQANLADCYVYGNGVEQNYRTAMEWYEKAADQDYAPAAFNIGRLYYNGRPGIGLNYAKAAFWYRKAAELGLSEAQNSLGVCYLKGQGVDRNQEEAFFWFEKSAGQDNSSGLYNLANCYRDGAGVKKDKNKARQIYQKAAEMGSPSAKSALRNL